MADAMDARDTDNLVVTTPEMVTLEYRLAGPGSRFLAQLIDFPIQLGLLLLAFLAALGVYRLGGNGNIAIIAGLLLGFTAVWGYFPICESVWSGKTLGKHVFGLRVVGDRGEPITLSQALIRNLVRIVDFLPLTYGVGIIVLFANGHGKRLGDLAAGTVVVREKAPVSLNQLRAGRPAEASEVALPPADAALLRGLAPDLRRLLVAYAGRRAALDPWRRHVLASRLLTVLQELQPQLVAEHGAVAAMDRLADIAVLDPAGHAAPAAHP
ncbi:MAG: RDD family protein [Candidatus Dormibacteraeota bacterium]|nr:RDD family protein [Candidatus Dormibacteraeota bacterium]